MQVAQYIDRDIAGFPGKCYKYYDLQFHLSSLLGGSYTAAISSLFCDDTGVVATTANISDLFLIKRCTLMVVKYHISQFMYKTPTHQRELGPFT